MPLPNEQQILRIWDAFEDAGFVYLSDSGELRTLEEAREARYERLPVRQDLLQNFLNGELAIERFKSEMGSEVASHRLWGFSGFSGQMFFNMLVSGTDSDTEPDLTELLREVLSAPDGYESGAAKIRKLEEYVTDLKAQAEDPGSAPSAGFVPYFVSYFWQLQGPDRYPIYYKSIRDALSDLDIWEPSGDYADDYVEFWRLNEEIREVIETHAGDDIHLWSIERLCLYWLSKDQIDRQTSPTDLAELLQRVLTQYPEDQIGQGLSSHQARTAVETDLPEALHNIIEDDSLEIEGSVGKGRWTSIPWVAIMDPRETTDTQNGLYVVYLFEPQEDRVRLSLGLGITKLLNELGKTEGRDRLEEQTAQLRKEVDLPEFAPGPAEFPHASGRNDLYGPGTVYYQEYQLSGFPSNEALVREVQTLTTKYQKLVSKRTEGRDTTRYFWINSASTGWYQEGGESFYKTTQADGTEHLNIEAYERAQPGDQVLVYRNAPRRAIVGKAHVSEGLHEKYVESYDGPADGITLTWDRSLEGVGWDDVADLPQLEGNPIVESNNPYIVTELSEDAYNTLLRLAEAGGPNHYWVTSNHRQWDVQSMSEGEEIFHTAFSEAGAPRNQQESFETAGAGDRVLFYASSPTSALVGEGTVVEGLHAEQHEGYDEPVEGVTIRYDGSIGPLNWDTIESMPGLADTAVVRTNGRGAIFPLPKETFEALRNENPLEDRIESLRGRLVRLSVSVDLPDELYYESEAELQRQIQASLNSGKHIIFTGPPGTGKTKLAKHVCERAVAAHGEIVDGYRFTTATAEWTTFDTIGGYVPNRTAAGDELVFQPRIFLGCFRRDGEIRNEWLVIDEINRSDIDKAFGQLFSVLSGDSVQLPYERDSPVEIASLDESASEERLKSIVTNPDIFPVTPSWRLLATMNTYDKTSLYELSYAFMRRFNFVHVGVPPLEENGEVRTSLLDPDGDENYATAWLEADESLRDVLKTAHEQTAVVWHKVNQHQTIGPSIVRDILGYLAAAGPDVSSDPGPALTDAVVALVFPQLEGMAPQAQRSLVDSLTATAVQTEAGPVDLTLDGDRLERKAEDFFDLPPRTNE